MIANKAFCRVIFIDLSPSFRSTDHTRNEQGVRHLDKAFSSLLDQSGSARDELLRMPTAARSAFDQLGDQHPRRLLGRQMR
jgi:hypothetical protein